jgi:hemin uptake protein HemP
VAEFSEDEIVESMPSVAKRVSRCDAHPKGSMLNPVSFDEISAGSHEIFVEYSDQLYRLSRTRLCKLILTKASNPFGS